MITSSPYLDNLEDLDQLIAREKLTSASICEIQLLENSKLLTKWWFIENVSLDSNSVGR